MTRNTISLRLPPSVHNAARKMAKLEHVSINQFIMVAVTEKLTALGVEEVAADHAEMNKRRFLSLLRKSLDAEPDTEDIL